MSGMQPKQPTYEFTIHLTSEEIDQVKRFYSHITFDDFKSLTDSYLSPQDKLQAIYRMQDSVLSALYPIYNEAIHNNFNRDHSEFT